MADTRVFHSNGDIRFDLSDLSCLGLRHGSYFSLDTLGVYEEPLEALGTCVSRWDPQSHTREMYERNIVWIMCGDPTHPK